MKYTIEDVFRGAYFAWSGPTGFGQLSFDSSPTGKLTCNNECMDRETVRKILHALADHVADTAEMEHSR